MFSPPMLHGMRACGYAKIVASAAPLLGLWALIGQWLEREGLRMTISSIADYDVASLNSHDPMGARTLCHIAVLRLGRCRLAFGARPLISPRGRKTVVRLRSCVLRTGDVCASVLLG